MRKHTYESLDRRASNRSWDKLLAVLHQGQLSFYKDARHREELSPWRGESPVALSGCSAHASDYPKKKNVISLRMPIGAEFLLQCQSEEDMARWLHELQLSTGQVGEGTEVVAESAQMETSGSQKKKGGFFSRGKK